MLELTAESAFPGGRVVVEAKQEKGFSIMKVLKELEMARENRQASVGVFVLARSHAPAGFGALSRHGKDVVVVWDDADETTDAYLQAAVLLALAMASRAHRAEDAGNIAALTDIESRIQAELTRLEKMRDIAEKIERHARDLQEEVRKGGKKLDVLLRNTKSTLRALNVELEEAGAVGKVPVAMPPRSLEAARSALVPVTGVKVAQVG